jgi:hypothetical protein
MLSGDHHLKKRWQNGEGGRMQTRKEKKKKEEGTGRDLFPVYKEGMTVIRREDDIQDLHSHTRPTSHTHLPASKVIKYMKQ